MRVFIDGEDDISRSKLLTSSVLETILLEKILNVEKTGTALRRGQKTDTGGEEHMGKGNPFHFLFP